MIGNAKDEGGDATVPCDVLGRAQGDVPAQHGGIGPGGGAL
jgi:hypothetical protein